MIHAQMKRLCEMLKRKAPWHGLDSTARQNPVNMTIIHQKTVQGGINKSVTDRLF